MSWVNKKNNEETKQNKIHKTNTMFENHWYNQTAAGTANATNGKHPLARHFSVELQVTNSANPSRSNSCYG